MNLNLVRIFTVLALAGSAALFAGSDTKLRVATMPATFQPVKGLEVSLTHQRGKVIARFKGSKTQDLGDFEKADIEPAVDEVVFGDFNFDGTIDTGILEGVGYNGVNLFYRIYLYDKLTSRFAKFKTTVSNPVLHQGQKLLVSAQRSGPRWYQTVYRSDAGSLQRVYEAEMLNIATLWGVSEYDASDRLVAQRVVDGETLERDPGAKRPPTRVLKPGTCSDLLRGQKKAEGLKVEILDFRDSGESLKVRPSAEDEGVWVAAECFAEGS